MRTIQVISQFGGHDATAKALGVSKSATYQWGDVVPERIAWQVQAITGGKLAVDPTVYEKRWKQKRAKLRQARLA